MDFGLTNEQIAVKDMARKFAEQEIAPVVKESDINETFPIDVVRRMGELGLMGGVIPQQYGGAEMDYVSYTLMVEEISRVCQMMGAVATWASGLMGAAIYLYGTEDQKNKYLKPLAQGRILGATALTEPRSGTDVAGMETRVTRDGDDYILTGSKIWISNLKHCKWFLTFATIDKEKGHKGICAFIVEKDWPGVSVYPFKNKLGFRALETGEVVFDGVRIPKENLVGQEGEGFSVAMCAVENGRLGVATRAVGVIGACYQESLEYAKTRDVFNKPIGQYQLVQSKLTDMAIGLETSRALIYKLAWLKDQGHKRLRKEASMAKMYATDTLMRSATDAAQIFGAYCASPEYNVNRYFRDAKILQIVEGSNDIHRVLIAETDLGYRRN